MLALGATDLYQGTKDFLQVAVNNGGFAVGCGTCALGDLPRDQLPGWLTMWISSRGKHQIAFGVDISEPGKSRRITIRTMGRSASPVSTATTRYWTFSAAR